MQLVEAVLDAIAAGRLGVGDRLPSVRDAAAEALVNPNTVARAWRELEVLGVVEGRAGSGVFVTSAGPDVARRERRKATLEALRTAAEEARRAGHDPEAIRAEVERALARTGGASARRSAHDKGGRG
jgi:GntR family transcriptional regulator